MAFVARPAAAADAPAQASALGARRCPMFQAERALGAGARPVRGCVAEPRAGQCRLAPAGGSGHTGAKVAPPRGDGGNSPSKSCH